jgi:hypothetical protein
VDVHLRQCRQGLEIKHEVVVPAVLPTTSPHGARGRVCASCRDRLTEAVAGWYGEVDRAWRRAST